MKQIVYVANSMSQNIEVWVLYKHGNMELIQTVQTDGQVQPISIIKNKNLLYAGVRPNNRIFTYLIDQNGLLKKIGESIIPGAPNYISFDNNENFLFCSSYHSNCISVSPLNKYGVPKNPIQIIYNIQGCHAAKFNNKYNILFITALKNDCIYLYHLKNFGILKNTEQKIIFTQSKSGPRHIVFHPNQNFFYIVNELNGTVDTWKIYKKNMISKVQKIQTVGLLNNKIEKKYWSSDIHLTSCGNFLYASDRYFNIISLFHINRNNNTITFFKKYYTEEQPRSFCIDNNNEYLIVAGEISNKLSLYRICKNTGDLTKINQYQTGQRPLWITSVII